MGDKEQPKKDVFILALMVVCSIFFALIDVSWGALFPLACLGLWFNWWEN